LSTRRLAGQRKNFKLKFRKQKKTGCRGGGEKGRACQEETSKELLVWENYGRQLLKKGFVTT
jgi:hypothetical protein